MRLTDLSHPNDEPQAQEAGAETLSSELGAWLSTQGHIAEDALSRARAVVADSESDLAEVLLTLGFVSDRALAEAFSAVMALELRAQTDFPAERSWDDTLSERFMIEHLAVPLAAHADSVTVAFAFPHQSFVVRALELAYGRPVTRIVASASDIRRFIEQYSEEFQGEHSVGGARVTDELLQGDAEVIRDLATGAPVVRYFNELLGKALVARASDIHIEPFERETRVRLRVDGVLQATIPPAPNTVAAVVSRIKLLGGLDIAERRLPQDGRIKAQVQGRSIDLRVSTIPTLHGESVVIRLLDQSSAPLDYDILGFRPELVAAIRECTHRPHGIFLVTGPTGSGKSTTLYTALNELNEVGRKIITVEDPVEYHIEGINQIQAKPAIGLTFANALRAIVRQDPDVIMIGEMRDLETAEIAVQSALTGHVVHSTLHTNNAAASITRLLDMGVEPFLVASTLNGVLAQRLVRRLCEACRKPATPQDSDVTGSQAMPGNSDPYVLQGCERCHGTGYRGRIAVAEHMSVDDAIRTLVLRARPSGEIAAEAIRNGMVPMISDGMEKVAQGLTTTIELHRVTRDAD